MRTTSTGLGTLALAATVLATLSGCGGSKGLSRAELIAKADPICKRAHEALASAHNLAFNSGSPDELKVAEADQRASTELAKLTPPSSMAADWRAIVAGWRTAGEGLTSMNAAGKAKDTRKALIAEGVFTKAQHDRAVTASHNGFNDCAKY